MEYPFKDLLPLDEVLEREGYYKDWKHLDPEVFYSLTQISQYIKTKGFGVDVRLLIAQLAEHFGLRVTQITDAMAEFGDLKTKVEELIIKSEQSANKSNLSLTKSDEALSNSQNALDVANGIDSKATNALNLSESANILSNSVQEQFNQVVINGDSSVESAQARVDTDGQTNPTLKARLDKEHNEVTTQLVQAENNLIQSQRDIRNSVYKGAIVSFSSDDGKIEDWTRFKPIFEEEGVPCNVCVPTQLVGNEGRMTWEQLRELKELGWSVGSHTHTHFDAWQWPEFADHELKRSSELLKENGLDHDILVYPYGHDVKDKEVVSRYYKMAVNIVRPNVTNLDGQIDNFNINRADGFSNGSPRPTLEQIKARVDQAIENNEWLIFEDHSHYDDYSDPSKLEELRQLIQYVKSRNVPIVNFSDGYTMKANALQVGDFRVSRSGFVSQNTNFLDYDVDTPLSDFPYGTTETFFTNAQISGKGFPDGNGGTVTTKRLRSTDYPQNENLSGVQSFQRYNENIIYTRRWETGDKWGEWEVFKPNINVFTGMIDMSTSYTWIPQIKVDNVVEFISAKHFGSSEYQIEFNKDIWHLSELGRTQATATKVGTIASRDLLVYVDSKNTLAMRFSSSGSNFTFYFRVAYC